VERWKDAETLNAFFDAVGEKETKTIEAVSMDLGPAFAKSVRTRAPHATICFDAFGVVKLVTDALDAVRRQVWQSARRLRDKTIAKKYKGARWALLKNPDDLNADQIRTLREIKKSGGALWRATNSRNPHVRCSPGTWTPTPLTPCWTAGAPKPDAAESLNSLKQPGLSGNIETASPPLSTVACPTDATKD